MSDDFDKRRPPGDEDDSDDESLDWQKDKSQKSGQSSSGENLGFTGELSWRKDVEDAFGEQLDAADDDAFDWQQDEGQPQGGSASSGGLGFTGQLDWKKTQAGADEPGASGDDESLDWLKSMDDEGAAPAEDDPFAESSPAAPSEPAYEDPLSWMDQYGDLEVEQPSNAAPSIMHEDDDLFATPPEQIDQPVEADDSLSWLNQFSAGDLPPSQAPAGGAEVPSWLNEAEDEAPQPGDADLPPWLSEAAPSEKPITEGGQLSDDWLAGAEEAPETASSEMSFDEWQRMQDAMTRPRDIDEEMPDLFSELNTAPPVNAEDLPQSDTGQLPSWVLGMEELDADDAPDWLSESEPAAAPPSAAPLPDDIFGELGLPSPETGYDFLDQPEEEEEDLLAGLNLGVPGDASDWYAETEQPAATKDAPDWLQDLGDLSETAAAPTIDIRSDAIPAEDDFLAELRGAPKQPAAEINPMDTSGLQDIDSLLASYEVATNLPSTDDLVDQSAEVDRLLSSNDLEQISARRGTEGRPGGVSGLSPDAPDWLAELGANVNQVSAAAIVRKQTQRERPLDELSDRLQALHERGLEMPTSEESKPSEVLRNLLPGVTEVLPAAPVQVTPGGLIGGLMLTDAQREKMNLLQALVGTDEEEFRRATRQSAIDLTLATPNLADLGIDDEPDLGTGATPEPEPAPVSRRTRRRPKIDRIVIALVLTVAVMLPFLVNSLRIGDLPPAQFAAGSPEQIAFDQVDSLRPGDLALIAAEYGPTGAGELDSALDAVFRHVLMRGARPVIISGNPVGLLHARNVVDNVTEDTAFLSQIDQPALQANRDYYVVRYLAASSIGLRSFSEDLPRLLALDINGDLTNLDAQTPRDFNLIAVVAESAEEIRAWSEQVAPLTGGPLVIITGQSAAPLSEPYVLPNAPQMVTNLGGMLVGYRDAYTYRTMLDARLSGALIAPIPTTETPDTTPTEETPLEPSPTIEGGAAAEATTEITPTEEEAEATPTREPAQPTNTVPPTATSTPTPTATASRTPTNTPTTTLTPSATATFEPALEVRGVIDSDQAVNVREGPGRTFAPISSLTPGTIVQIIGRNGDGEWLQIRLEDGREGWVSASLVAVEEPEAAAETRLIVDLDSQYAGLISDVVFYAPAAQETTPTIEAEADAETTPEVTDEPAATEPAATVTPVVPAATSTMPYRDERWYGMTLGLVAIILVIAIGMIANILRGLFRRGK
jgi:hypothetical protein